MPTGFPRMTPAAPAQTSSERVPVWTPERRTELADQAVETLMDIGKGSSPSPARVKAMRVLLDAVFDDARGA